MFRLSLTKYKEQAMLTYCQLEARYGEPLAQFLVKEMEKTVHAARNDNEWAEGWDWEARLARVQSLQDR